MNFTDTYIITMNKILTIILLLFYDCSITTKYMDTFHLILFNVTTIHWYLQYFFCQVIDNPPPPP